MPPDNGFMVNKGLRILPGFLGPARQRAVLAAAQDVMAAAPLYQPVLPKSGKPFSVKMTNCGPLGWVSDQAGGYRYQKTHPETGAPWPAVPETLEALWREVSGYPHPFEACLINHYPPGSRMGLHQDRDEAARDAPVVSVSLGDTCVFRIGGLQRNDPTRSVKLTSGDVVVLGGDARLVFHGVDRIIAGTSRLLAEAGLGEGRVNITLRRVTIP